jgi:hypothetical protein
MKISEFKESVVQVIRERSINAISKLQQRNIENIASALEFYKKNKHTDKKEPFIKLLKKLGKEKVALAKELDMKVSGMYKNAEYKGESVVNERYSDFIKAKNLTDIVALSKKKKNATFYVTDDNNSRIGTFYLKNGKFAKATTANANYDLQNSKTSLKDRSDVIYKYKVDESIINESPSSEELRIVMMAVRKIAKYRNVPIDQSINDVLNAVEQLKRDIKKGKIKK